MVNNRSLPTSLFLGPGLCGMVSSLQRKPKGSVDTKEAADPTEAVMWMGPERDLGVRQKNPRPKEG